MAKFSLGRVWSDECPIIQGLSTNLTSWAEIAQFNAATNSATPLVPNLSIALGFATLTLTDTGSTGLPRYFYRLKVSTVTP